MQHSADDAIAGPCVDCGGSYPSIGMDFAHVRDAKKYAVSAMVGFSPATIALAIAKCDLICAYCERERSHALGLYVDPFLERFMRNPRAD